MPANICHYCLYEVKLILHGGSKGTHFDLEWNRQTKLLCISVKFNYTFNPIL